MKTAPIFCTYLSFSKSSLSFFSISKQRGAEISSRLIPPKLPANKETVLTNQLIRSGTSVGANIREAFYAHGKADFVSKLQIALKECYETEYWIELFVKSELLNREIAKELYNQCGTIRRMLISSINTAKEKANDKK
mgnify:CR=1 FL=1